MQPPFDIAADLDTPVSAYLKLAALKPRFLLESVEGGEQVASAWRVIPSLVLAMPWKYAWTTMGCKSAMTNPRTRRINMNTWMHSAALWPVRRNRNRL